MRFPNVVSPGVGASPLTLLCRKRQQQRTAPKAQCQASPDNPETGDIYEYHSRERRSCVGHKIVESTKTYPGCAAAAAEGPVYTYACIQANIRVHTSDADFQKPGIYGGRVPVWATEWGVFHCPPSRGGRGRRAAVDIFRGVVFSVWWDFVRFFLFFPSNAPGLCRYETTLPHVPVY